MPPEMPTAEKGSDLVFTIDRKVQAAVEDIRKAIDETGRWRYDPGYDPAMAESPYLHAAIDINRYWQYPS
jgi:cell division protein FtsI/penicillin-binding protein 2